MENATGDAVHIFRAKVPGGWLVRTVDDVVYHDPDGQIEYGREWRDSICFVPDPNYEWK